MFTFDFIICKITAFFETIMSHDLGLYNTVAKKASTRIKKI